MMTTALQDSLQIPDPQLHPALLTQATVHGVCKGDLVTNAHEDIDTDVTLHRWDLSKCSHFSPLRLTSSPLALIRGLVS